MAALIEVLLARYAHIDVVVSNAGRSIRRSVADTADRFHDVQRLITINHLGPVQLLLGLLPTMRAAGRGHIVNVSTAALGFPSANWSTYVSSKRAFDAWMRGKPVDIGATVRRGLLNFRKTGNPETPLNEHDAGNADHRL